MDTRVWTENCGGVAWDALRLEARRLSAQLLVPHDMKSWREERARMLAAVEDSAGSWPAACPLELAEHGRRLERGGFHVRKLTYQSRRGLRVTSNLYVPDGRGPWPAVLLVHGHNTAGKGAPGHQEIAQALVLDGFVCLVVDAIGAGERGRTPGQFEYHGGGIGAGLLPIGETLLGMQVYDNRRALDLLASLDFVDKERIGVTGASGGGNQTLWLAALDERIRAAVPVVSVGTFEAYVGRHNCMCEVLPGGLRILEEWGALALAAPRAMLMLNSLQDEPSFAVTEMIRSYDAARKVYALFDAHDRISYQVFASPHGYQEDKRRSMLGWFRRWLKEQGEGGPCELPETEALAESECLCFPDGVRPPAAASIPEFISAPAQREAAQHLVAGVELSVQTKVDALRDLLGLPDGSLPCAVSAVQRNREDGLDVRRFVLEGEPGFPLPVVMVCESGPFPSELCILLHPGGKQVGVDEAKALRLVTRGCGVVLVDLRCTGETQWEARAPDARLGRFHDTARACLWLGRTLMGDWVRDVLTLAAYLQGEFPGAHLSIMGHEETALAGVLAAAVSGDFGAVRTHHMLGSIVPRLGCGGDSMAHFVPGMLAWGDVSMAVALAAEATIEVLDPVDCCGDPLSDELIAGLDRDIEQLAGSLGLPKRARVERSP